MSETAPAIPYDEIYPLYVQFWRDMNADRGEGVDPYPEPKSEEDFPSLLASNPPHVQENLIKDYRKGYAAVMREAEVSIAEVTKFYSQPE